MLTRTSPFARKQVGAAIAVALLTLSSAFAATAATTAATTADTTTAPAKKAAAKPATKAAAKPVVASTPMAAPTQPTEVAPPMQLTVGKSTLLRVPQDLTRVSVGNPDTADVTLINSREIYLLGKKTGSTNVFLWSKGKTTVMDVRVGIDTGSVRSRIAQLMPNEKGINVDAAGDSLVLSGRVADSVKVQRAVLLAEQYGGKKVVNMLTTADTPQVMLEVKVAEVSKTLLDKLGTEFSGVRNAGNFTYSLLSSLLSEAGSALTITQGTTRLTLDAETKKGLVKILAEPTIMAISGQEGAFLAGGKIFIPVERSTSNGALSFTLEEKEFGVGLKFTPTVLEGGMINLRVAPEVSELSQVGSAFTTVNGVTSILPSITTRRASTTVQLLDGQSFAIGGLIKNNVNEAIKAFPVLGEVPVLGALFRSSEFQSDRSELLFIVTPRLVKPLDPNYALPTDKFIAPSRSQFLLNGQLEGTPPEPAAPAEQATPPKAAPQGAESGAQRGFELK